MLGRELAKVLDYDDWRNFTKVIDKAIITSDTSGHMIIDHFVDINKMVEIGSKTERRVNDFELSRCTCYLIVQNGDPRKETIALGQTYFAIQTYRQELADRFNQLDEDRKRPVIRGDIRQWNQLLVEAAKDAGVITPMQFSAFQNAGYTGLYGGLTMEDIHKTREIGPVTRYLISWVARNLRQICSV